MKHKLLLIAMLLLKSAYASQYSYDLQIKKQMEQELAELYRDFKPEKMPYIMHLLEQKIQAPIPETSAPQMLKQTYENYNCFALIVALFYKKHPDAALPVWLDKPIKRYRPSAHVFCNLENIDPEHCYQYRQFLSRYSYDLIACAWGKCIYSCLAGACVSFCPVCKGQQVSFSSWCWHVSQIIKGREYDDEMSNIPSNQITKLFFHFIPQKSHFIDFSGKAIRFLKQDSFFIRYLNKCKKPETAVQLFTTLLKAGWPCTLSVDELMAHDFLYADALIAFYEEFFLQEALAKKKLPRIATHACRRLLERCDPNSERAKRLQKWQQPLSLDVIDEINPKLINEIVHDQVLLFETGRLGISEKMMKRLQESTIRYDIYGNKIYWMPDGFCRDYFIGNATDDPCYDDLEKLLFYQKRGWNDFNFRALIFAKRKKLTKNKNFLDFTQLESVLLLYSKYNELGEDDIRLIKNLLVLYDYDSRIISLFTSIINADKSPLVAKQLIVLFLECTAIDVSCFGIDPLEIDKHSFPREDLLRLVIQEMLSKDDLWTFVRNRLQKKSIPSLATLCLQKVCDKKYRLETALELELEKAHAIYEVDRFLKGITINWNLFKPSDALEAIASRYLTEEQQKLPLEKRMKNLLYTVYQKGSFQ